MTNDVVIKSVNSKKYIVVVETVTNKNVLMQSPKHVVVVETVNSKMW